MRGLARPFALLCFAGMLPAQELTDATLERWRDYILPSADELRWREIPWRPELRTALEDARALNKPILLWTMNGHPLGCT